METPIKVVQINLNHRDMFNSVMDVYYDMLNDGVDSIACITAFKKPENMLQTFKDGWTFTLVASHMEEIEKYHQENTPFMIVIWKDEKIWAVINGEDCNY